MASVVRIGASSATTWCGMSPATHSSAATKQGSNWQSLTGVGQILGNGNEFPVSHCFLGDCWMSIRSCSPLSQIWLIVFMLIGLQYSLAMLVYFGYLGEIFRSKAFIINGALAVLLSLIFSGPVAVKQLFAPYARLPRNFMWVVMAVLWNFPLILLAVAMNDL